MSRTIKSRKIYSKIRPEPSPYKFSSDDYDSDTSSPSPLYRIKKRSSINWGRWQKEEDERLKELVETYGEGQWDLISGHFPDRDDLQCYHRWYKVLNPELVKGPWTKEEDDKVIELVKKFGPKKWTLIAKLLGGRIGKQCRERWHNHLNPSIKKTAWTLEEERIIYQYHRMWGNQWSKISKQLSGRTDNSIKNYWNSTLKKHAMFVTDKVSYAQVAKQKKKRRINQTSTQLNRMEKGVKEKEFQAPRIRSGKPVSYCRGGFSEVLQPTVQINVEPIVEEEILSMPRDFCDYFKTEPLESPVKVKEEVNAIEFIPGSLNGSPLSADMSVLDMSEIINTGSFANLSMSDLVNGTDISLPNTPMKPILQTHITYTFDGSIYEALKQESLNDNLIPIPSPLMTKLTSPKLSHQINQTTLQSPQQQGSFLSNTMESDHQKFISFLKPVETAGSLVNLNNITSSIEVKEEKEELFPSLDYKVFNQYLSSTPAKGTPLKTLNFSPSQFLNSPVIKMSNNALTSTPNHYIYTQSLCGMDNFSSVLQTPKVLMFDFPNQNVTPIKDISSDCPKSLNKKRDAFGLKFSNKTLQQDSAIGSMISKGFQELDLANKENLYPAKTARKALHKAWITEIETDNYSGTDLMNLETLSISLLGESSVAFSPPSVIKEALLRTHLSDEMESSFAYPSLPKKKKQGRKEVQKPRKCSDMKKKQRRKEVQKPRKCSDMKAYLKWRRIAFGMTSDQRALTKQAREFLSAQQQV